MIQIIQLKLPCTHTQQELREKIERTLRIRPEELIEYSIEKQSIDARKKPQIFMSIRSCFRFAGEKGV
mgnify:CR=1 FL=1